MGRMEKSQGLAPPSVRKDARAKQARLIVNKTIPAILASNPRAKKGVESSILFADPGPVAEEQMASNGESDQAVHYARRKGQGRRKLKHGMHIDNEVFEDKGKSKSTVLEDNPSSQTKSSTSLSAKIKVRIIQADSLTAANILNKSKGGSHPNVCVLNMASPLRPGGGVLTGATSQEEFLCARTTLLPSLNESFYRLPETGGILTKDVLVFRSSGPMGDSNAELAINNRYWIDVISAGMLRFPELEGDDEEVKRLNKQDRSLTESKMRAVMRIASSQKSRKLVLGAWGCGAYANPIIDVAQAWKSVIFGDTRSGKGLKSAEHWPYLEEIIFAITNKKMAKGFAEAFDTSLTIEVIAQVGSTEEDEDNDKEAEELKEKIEQLEDQILQLQNPDSRSRLSVIVQRLRAELDERKFDG